MSVTAWPITFWTKQRPICIPDFPSLIGLDALMTQNASKIRIATDRRNTLSRVRCTAQSLKQTGFLSITLDQPVLRLPDFPWIKICATAYVIVILPQVYSTLFSLAAAAELMGGSDIGFTGKRKGQMVKN